MLEQLNLLATQGPEVARLGADAYIAGQGRNSWSVATALCPEV